MSYIKETSHNLNKSVFNNSFFSASKGGFSVYNDNLFLQQIITNKHLKDLTNICFDKCVKNFSTIEFTSEESTCLNVCKNDGLNALSNLQYFAEN